MIQGTVHSNGDAVIQTSVRGPAGIIVDVSTVIDTGFDGGLTLSAQIVSQLALELWEEVLCTLGDGSESWSELFAAEILWHNGWRPVFVVRVEGEPLLGMGALRGSFLGVEVIDGGRVEIRALAK